ncbi:MAG: hypothetical protein Q8908_00910 [Bacteroidota bacterium]|nr:hypothetical protein [Bacteroidota bacterium]
MKYYFCLIVAMSAFIWMPVNAQTSGEGKIYATPYRNLVTNNWKGIVWEPFNRDWKSEETSNDGKQIADCGIRWARVWVTAGKDYSQAEAMVKQCKVHHIEIICCYNKSNPTNDLGDSVQQAEQVSRLKDFVRHFKQDIHYWEIQNEANLDGSWNLGKEVGRGGNDFNSPYNSGVHRFVQWLQLSYKAIKEVDPKATVILGGLSEWIMEDFMDRLTVEKAYQYFDEVAFHPYAVNSNPVPDQCYKRMLSFKSKMLAWPKPKNDMPIWITEIGFHTGNISSPGIVSSEEIKAVYLKETIQMLIQNMPYSRPICWYIFHEVNANNTYFGLVTKYLNGSNVETTFLPAYVAFKGMDQNWSHYARSVSANPKK